MGLMYLEIRLTKCLLYLKLNDVHFTISSTFANILNIPKEKESQFDPCVPRGTVAISPKLLVVGEGCDEGKCRAESQRTDLD